MGSTLSPRRTILAVDDDSDIGRLLARMLRADYDVRSVDSGAAALKIVRDHAPDLLILDIAMPKMNGLLVLDAALKISPNLHVVMLTGSLDLETVSRALNHGAEAYLTKPFLEDELRNVVGHLLQPADERAKNADSPPWRLANE